MATMISDGQQDQQQVEPPVAQQPAVASSRFRKCPYVKTGFRLSNGWRIPGAFFVLLLLAGGIMIFLGLLFVIIVPNNRFGGAFLAFIGVIVYVPGNVLCVMAKRQYKTQLLQEEDHDTPPPTPHLQNP